MALKHRIPPLMLYHSFNFTFIYTYNVIISACASLPAVTGWHHLEPSGGKEGWEQLCQMAEPEA